MLLRYQSVVFDEATSALDNKTEKEVIRALETIDSNLTLIMVAHRLSTLQYCDNIIKLDKGTVVFNGSYDEYFNKNQ